MIDPNENADHTYTGSVDTKGVFCLKENIFQENNWISYVFSYVWFLSKTYYPKTICL